MQEKKISPQAKRLKDFVDLTGYSLNEFAKQCGIPSVRSVSAIVSEGSTPSSKILDKIVNRFPQLNYDWVILGYGEMIVKGFENREVSAGSHQKSTQASFGTIQQSMTDHDFSLNELAKRVDKAINRVDTTSEFLIEAAKAYTEKQVLMEKLFFEKVDNKINQVDQHVAQLFHLLNQRDKEGREEEDRRIEKLDDQRRELREKDAKILFEQFDRLSRKIKQHLDETKETQKELIQDRLDDARLSLHNDLKAEAQNILSQSLEALQLGFAQIDINSHKRYSEALVKLGVMEKHKKD